MKKINQKILLAIFLVLLVIAALFYFLDRRTGDRTFRSELFELDSANITSVTVYPKGGNNPSYQLIKSGPSWELSMKNHRWPTDSNAIRNAISILMQVKPQRVAGKDESSWKNFDLTDSLSMRVVVEEQGETTADFRIGKVTFTQSGPQGYGGNRQMMPLTYIRVAGDEKAYVVEGFISMLFADNPSMFRNRSLLKVNKDEITRLSFNYPGDSSFVLVRTPAGWSIDNRPADSAKVATFLGTLANLSWHEFADDITPPAFFPYKLTIGGDQAALGELSGVFIAEPKNYLVTSASNPGVLFGSANPSLFYRVFPVRNYFQKPN